MKVAIVHYWLVTMRGGEKVLEELCKIFPQADVYTNVYNPKKISQTIKSHKIFTTKVNKYPMATKLYQKFLTMSRCFCKSKTFLQNLMRKILDIKVFFLK